MPNIHSDINEDEIMRMGLCIISEMLLRNLNLNANQSWFVDIDENVIYNSIISKN